MICEKTGKRSYRTKMEADADITRFAQRAGRQPVRSYQCDACWGFHTTADLAEWRAHQKGKGAA